MRGVRAIAWITWKEALRNRVLYLLLFFTFAFVMGSRILALLTVGDPIKIVIDLGLTIIYIMDLLLTVFVGLDLVFRELEKKTIYIVLTRPVYRYEFILGKYFGFAFTVGVLHVLMSALFSGYLLVIGGWTSRILLGFLAIYLEILIVASFAVFFSTFSTPIMSGIFTLGLWLVGRGSRSLLMLAEKIHSEFARTLLEFIFFLLPDLSRFQLDAYVVHGLSLQSGYMFVLLLKMATHVLFFLACAILIFQRRNIT